MTLTGTNILTMGGILVTPTVGANAAAVSGGTLYAATTNNNYDLTVSQYNTAGDLTISSIIANAPAARPNRLDHECFERCHGP